MLTEDRFGLFLMDISFIIVLYSAISTEEDRLWSIVRANSLDFNAWTALIQETEKLAEVSFHYSSLLK